MKLSWHVPRATKTYLLQNVLACGTTSAKVDILARYGTFFNSLRKSPSYEVAVLANIVGRDVRSKRGSNSKLLEKSSCLNSLIYSSARLKMEPCGAAVEEISLYEAKEPGFSTEGAGEGKLEHFFW